MSKQHNKIPIGSLLQNAGLISAEQLQQALEIQAQYTQMKLGEILVLQQGLRAKTIDFFVEKWQEFTSQGQIFPLGYYLKNASLLNDKQIETILQEQKTNQQKFGVLAVQKGWVKQDTIDFFLNNLAAKPPQIISLTMLEAYNQSTLHLEKKYANHSLILSRILAWTGGIPTLTKTVCQTFAKSDSNIPSGSEIKAVDRFVEGTLIRNWQKSPAGTSIRAIKHSLLNNVRCDSYLLLTEYQDIFVSGSKPDQDSKEQKELLLLGLVVLENDSLKISNIIYQQIFNQEFIIEHLNKLKPKDELPNQDPEDSIDRNFGLTQPNNSIVEYAPVASIAKVVSPPTQTEVEAEVKPIETQSDRNSAVATPEPLTRIGSIITCAAIALLIPLFLTINNYYSSLSRSGRDIANPESAQEVDQLRQSCNQLNFSTTDTILSSISKLEAEQQQLAENYPANCEVALNRLRVIAAPQLGKESRILEAIRQLCKVPADSEMYVDAEVWLKRWYNSANWGQETKFYLQERSKYDDSGCPAAHFTEYESSLL
ncbi:MAG: hypothetical protein AAFO85_14940 [Cyanobacteria bacterium J06598_4]